MYKETLCGAAASISNGSSGRGNQRPRAGGLGCCGAWLGSENGEQPQNRGRVLRMTLPLWASEIMLTAHRSSFCLFCSYGWWSQVEMGSKSTRESFFLLFHNEFPPVQAGFCLCVILYSHARYIHKFLITLSHSLLQRIN